MVYNPSMEKPIELWNDKAELVAGDMLGNYKNWTNADDFLANAWVDFKPMITRFVRKGDHYEAIHIVKATQQHQISKDRKRLLYVSENNLYLLDLTQEVYQPKLLYKNLESVPGVWDIEFYMFLSDDCRHIYCYNNELGLVYIDVEESIIRDVTDLHAEEVCVTNDGVLICSVEDKLYYSVRGEKLKPTNLSGIEYFSSIENDPDGGITVITERRANREYHSDDGINYSLVTDNKKYGFPTVWGKFENINGISCMIVPN